MTQAQKNAKNDPFLKLENTKKTFIELDFEGNLSNKEIADKIGVSRVATISNWRSQAWYLKGREAYMNRLIKYKYKSKALQTVYDLLDAKSEMVRLQSASTIFKLSGLLSDNSTPELDKARLRKAIAEAELTEIKAEQLKHIDENAEDKLSKIAGVLWGDTSDKDK